MQELVAEEGIAPEVAALNIEEEIANEEAAEMLEINDRCKAEEKALKVELESKLAVDTAGMIKQYQESVAKLGDSLLAEKEAERRKLEEMLAARRAARKQQLIDSGTPPIEAEMQVEQEFSKETNDLLDAVNAEITDAETVFEQKAKALKLANALTDDFSDESKRLRELHEKSIAALDARLASSRRRKPSTTPSRRAWRRRRRRECRSLSRKKA